MRLDPSLVNVFRCKLEVEKANAALAFAWLGTCAIPQQDALDRPGQLAVLRKSLVNGIIKLFLLLSRGCTASSCDGMKQSHIDIESLTT